MLDFFCFQELKALSNPGKLLKAEMGKTFKKAKMASNGPAFSHYASDPVRAHPRPVYSPFFLSIFLPIRADLPEGKVLISSPLRR